MKLPCLGILFAETQHGPKRGACLFPRAGNNLLPLKLNNHTQYNPVNTDTKGTAKVSVFSGVRIKRALRKKCPGHVLLIQGLNQTSFYGNKTFFNFLTVTVSVTSSN